MTTRRSPIYGPEPYADLAGQQWSHWDRWFCLACVLTADGDWDALEDEVVRRHRRRSLGSRDWERKRSHLIERRNRLAEAGLSAEELAGDTSDAKLREKALRKVLDQGLAGRDLTPAMRDTPRDRLQTRALRGHWAAFPASPEPLCEAFADVLDGGGSSFRRAVELEALVGEAHQERDGDPAGQLAVWRGLLTAGVEAYLAGLRDSDGAVGSLLSDALDTYVDLPWREAGIDPQDYWADLCEWSVWEHWGIRSVWDGVVFRQARRDEVPLIDGLLQRLDREHAAERLDYEADDAAQLRAWLAIATARRSLFVPVAERLRAEWWIPVDAMGRAAVEAGDVRLAREVYATAIAGGGLHVDNLARRCRERTGADP